MRVLNLKEFGDYCKTIKPNCYVFSTENQANIVSTLHISLRFDKIFITLHPNIISLIGERSRLIMRDIKQVYMYDDIQSIGIRTDVICEENNRDIIYTLLID